MNEFVSLEKTLENWFEKSLDDLPDGLRKKVERGFRPLFWDKQTPEDRRKRANHWDCLRNPVIQKWEKRLWLIRLRMDELEEKIEEWETVSIRTARDLELKGKNIEELQSELLMATQEFEREVKSDLSIRNAKLQDAANKLAEQWKKDVRKPFTKRQIAEDIFNSEEWSPMSESLIERIIRKEW